MVSTNGKNALNRNIEYCFICGGIDFVNRTSDYEKCLSCGHEILVSTKEQGFIINDSLSEKDVRRITSLDRFKARTLAYFDSNIERDQLLDIGSASGKFILQNMSRYKRTLGLEITPESLNFSGQILGLNIVEDIQSVSQEVNIATAWHSLEHIPEQQLLSLLDGLSSKMVTNGRFIVSVPNGASSQYHWFKKSYAYYDTPNHLHQFTPDSLDKLLQRFGFKELGTVTSWPYNIFGYTQSLLNILTNTHNYFYYRLKRKSCEPSLAVSYTHLTLATKRIV